MARLQVFLGRPCFILPGDVLFAFILRVCTNHLSHLRFISNTISWDFDLLYSFLFETFIGKKKNWQILLRLLLWNALIFCMSFFVTLQHSDPYSSTGLSKLLYSKILYQCCTVLMFFRLQMLLWLYRVLLVCPFRLHCLYI